MTEGLAYRVDGPDLAVGRATATARVVRCAPARLRRSKAAPAPRHNVLVIYRRGRGWWRRRLFRRSLRGLVLLGCTITVCEVAGAAEAEELARRRADDGHDAIIAAGGDAIVAAVATGVGGGAPAVGVLPVGRRNRLAARIGLPGRATAAAMTIVWGRTKLASPAALHRKRTRAAAPAITEPIHILVPVR